MTAAIDTYLVKRNSTYPTDEFRCPQVLLTYLVVRSY
jgi:hypothetical protein